jgi:hypothetical protein
VVGRAAAVVYAASMAETAAVIFAESNRRNRHAKPLPTTCEDVENSPEVKSKLKPVIAVAAMPERQCR